MEFLVVPYGRTDASVPILASAPRLRVVQSLSAGVDDLVNLVPAGVTLCNARGVHDTSTAELAVSLALASLRGTPDFVPHDQQPLSRASRAPRSARDIRRIPLADGRGRPGCDGADRAAPRRPAHGASLGFPVVEGLLLPALLAGDPRRIDRRTASLRAVSITLVGALALSAVWSTVHLVDDLVHGGRETDSASRLLQTGGTVWVCTVPAFSPLYYELDSGGAAARAHHMPPTPALVFSPPAVDAIRAAVSVSSARWGTSVAPPNAVHPSDSATR
ncbi:hypothetical protein [Streptomyces sp. NPDC058579]|uniref:hypothetical protein n=1 Tax=Streptomyces sp. NPDC058579 TaxID=3346548 RepID=UPI003663510D